MVVGIDLDNMRNTFLTRHNTFLASDTLNPGLDFIVEVDVVSGEFDTESNGECDKLNAFLVNLERRLYFLTLESPIKMTSN